MRFATLLFSVILFWPRVDFAQDAACVSGGFYKSEIVSYGNIKKGSKLLANQSVTSPNGKFQLAINNGQLVIESILEEKECNGSRYVKTKPVWTASSARHNNWGKPAQTSFSIQADCNMVFSSTQNDFWFATNGNDANKVILNQCSRGFVTDDGRLVLLNGGDKEIWQSKKPTPGSITSGTYKAPCFNDGFQASNTVGHGFMRKGQIIRQNESITSFSGEYQLAINSEQDLVMEKILETKACDGQRFVRTQVVWKAPSFRQMSWKAPAVTSFELQGDCNMVFRSTDHDFWLATNGSDANKRILNSCTKAFISDDGRLALLNSANQEIWHSAPAPAGSITRFTYVDKSKMIPLSYTEVHNDFAMKLVGGAVKDSVIINFDTGSWTTSIPYKRLNKANIRVIKKGVKDDWGQDADLVKGTFFVKSVDGSITYTIKDYEFFAIKDGGTRMIMGAFPSISWKNMTPFPFALEQKYAKGKGFALISNGTGQNLERDWSKTKFYMSLGLPSDANKNIRWSETISTFSAQPFAPDYIGNFKISVTPNGSSETYTTGNTVATIDTGAPELTLRLGKDNPQNRPPFKSHFVKEGQWTRWGESEYTKSATNFINGKVSVAFTDNKGQDFSYSFAIGNNPSSPHKNLLTAGTWEGGVPWGVSPRTPHHRINLGNSLYYFAPVFYYDRANKRVGFGFIE